MSKYAISELEKVTEVGENDLLLVSRMDDDGNPIASNSIAVKDLMASFSDNSNTDVVNDSENDCQINVFNDNSYAILSDAVISAAVGNFIEADIFGYRSTTFSAALTATSKHKSYKQANFDYKVIDGEKYIDISSATNHFLLSSNTTTSVYISCAVVTDFAKDDLEQYCVSCLIYSEDNKKTIKDLFHAFLRKGAENFYYVKNDTDTNITSLIQCMNYQDIDYAAAGMSKSDYQAKAKPGAYYNFVEFVPTNAELDPKFDKYVNEPKETDPITITDDCIFYLNAGVCMTPGTTVGKTSSVVVKYKDPSTGNNGDRYTTIYQQYCNPAANEKTFNTVNYAFKAKAGTTIKIGVQLDDTTCKYYYNASKFSYTMVKSTPWDICQAAYLKIPVGETSSAKTTVPVSADITAVLATITDAVFATTGTYVNASDKTNNLYVKDVTDRNKEKILATFELNNKAKRIPVYSFYVRPESKIQLTTSRKTSKVASNTAKIEYKLLTESMPSIQDPDLTLKFDTNKKSDKKRYAYGWKFLRYNIPQNTSEPETSILMQDENGIVLHIYDSEPGWFVHPPAGTKELKFKNVSEIAISELKGDYLIIGERLTDFIISNKSKLNSLNDYCFYACKNLTNFSNVNDITSLTDLGDHAFTGSNVSDVKLNHITAIAGDSNFMNCTSLTSMHLSSFAGAVPKNFAYGCNNLKTVDIRTATSVLSKAFSGKNANNVPSFLSIVSCAANASIADNQACFNKLSAIESNAFEYCNELTSVTLPDVESIGKAAFNACSAITQVNVPKIKTIGENSFNANKELKLFVVGNSLTSISNGAFKSSKDCVFDFRLLTGNNVPTLGNVNAFPSPSTTTYQWKIQVTQEMYDKLKSAPNWQKFATSKYNRFEVWNNGSIVQRAIVNGKEF